MRYVVSIGYRIPASEKNSACLIPLRHRTVSGGDVNMPVVS